MARPSKPIHLVKGHRTKKEKKVREVAEKSLLTGSSFKECDEVKKDKIAHKEFVRLKKLFRAIGKDEGLHESVINRFCLLHSECKKMEILREDLLAQLEPLENARKNNEIDFINYLAERNKIQDRYMQCDKKVMEKRKMMLDIEKENIMTIASVLRSIPKKPIEDTESDPMARLLGG